MAAAAPPVRVRHRAPENIIKQGYLKKSVRSNDLLPSAPKQLANNIKQKLEPSRWYVFGVRYRLPYLEYYDKEESVFSGQAINTFDLSTYESLSYTMGRTNTTFSFCLVLSDRTIELNAPDRPQMLEWCRCFERNLHNLGLRTKNAKEEHQYVAFPVKRAPVPRRSSSPEPVPGLTEPEEQHNSDQENIYEEAPDFMAPDSPKPKDASPELPPRLPQRTSAAGDEEVFASLYSVKRDLVNQTHDYHSFDGDEATCRQESLDNDDDDVTGALDRTGDDLENSADNCYSKSTKSKTANSGGNGEGVLVNLDDDLEEDGDRCTSLPVMPSKPTEQDTSEDSDFISASFWLRNRKTEDLILLDDECKDAETIKRKLPPLPKNFSDPAPPVPLRCRSERPRPTPRKCVSMNLGVSNFRDSGRISPSLDALGLAPAPPTGKVPEAKLYHLDNLSAVPRSEPDQTKNTVKDRIVESQLDCDQSSHMKPVDEYESPDDQTYETLVAKATEKSPETKSTADTSETLYEAAWQLKKSNKSEKELFVDLPEADCKSELKDHCTQVKQVQRSKTTATDFPKRKSKITRLFTRTKSTELPEALAVSLPPPTSHCNGESEGASTQEADQDGNLYSDFPEKPKGDSSVFGNVSCNEYEPTKFSSETRSSNDNSPVLPRRIFHSKGDNTHIHHHNGESSSKHGNDMGAAGDSRSRNLREWSASPPQNRSDKFNHSMSVDSAPSSVPVAPPRRHKMVKAHTVDKSPHTTVIDVKLSGPVASPRVQEDEPPARPPPRKSVMMRKAVSTDASVSNNELHSSMSANRPKSVQILHRQQTVGGGQSGGVTVMNLKQNQVDILRSEIESTGGMMRSIPKVHFQNGLALVECFEKVWIAGWDLKKYPRLYDKFHIGDQVLSINNVQVTDVTFAQKVVKNVTGEWIDITVRRLPYAKVYAIQRSAEGESLGIKREGGTAEIIYVDPYGLANKHGLMNRAVTLDGSGVCTWTLTEINMRPLNLFFKDNEIEHRLMAVGKDISIVVQPTDFVRELKKQLRRSRSYKDYLVQ